MNLAYQLANQRLLWFLFYPHIPHSKPIGFDNLSSLCSMEPERTLLTRWEISNV